MDTTVPTPQSYKSANQKSLIPFDIRDLQFIVGDHKDKTEILPDKTPYYVCCDLTVQCLEGLVPYNPDEKDFTFFANTFSKPHQFGLGLILPKIIKDPEKLDYYFQLMEKKVQELSRTDLRAYFFRCVEIDVNWDFHKDTTGEPRFGFMKFADRMDLLKQKVLSQKNVEKAESESEYRYPDLATFNRVLATDYLLGSQLLKNESVPTITETPKKGEKKLPPFEEIIKDPAILPGLWKYLSDKLDKPFVSEAGEYIGNTDQNASPLMALAYVLIDRKLLKTKPKLSQTNIYKILCNYFDVPFATAPHRARSTHTYDDISREIARYFDRFI